MSDSASPSPSVLVIGAGELGTAVLDALVKHPKRQSGKISVLLRQSSIESQDADKKKNVDRIRSLRVGLEAGDFCAGYGFPAGTGVRTTRAAIEVGISRFFPFQFGVDYDAIGEGNSQGLFDEMLEVRKLLRGQDKTGWTIVSTGLFVSYLFLPGFGIVDFKEHVVRALGTWDTSVTVSTLEAIGTMVAEVVYVPGDIMNQVVYIGGETISYRRLADLVEATYQVPFKREVWDVASLKKILEDNPDDLFARYRVVFGAGIGVAWDMDKTLNRQRGIPLANVGDFVRANKESIGSQT
ncbi:hypothetical protein B0H66DRAFT_638690 [Apodospora peruviana]|uniref:NmrA-like domain-containing protein n=1 Tax=Apodospora peruviana TaxID=516989 RepID=A0AAE0M897_9PEZI|nr:hypothetical protein B0H66DRAFT_638690 [Apodospora peruviana]